MKICWDNLEKLNYVGNGLWKSIKWSKFFTTVNSCKVCSEEFLSQIQTKKTKPTSIFCCRSCQMSFINKGEKNSNWKGGVFKNNKPTFNHYYKRLKKELDINNFRKNKNQLVELKCCNCNKWFVPDTTKLLNILNKITINIFCNKKCKVKYLLVGKNNPNYKGGYRGKNIPRYNNYASQISYCEEVRRNKQDENILEVKCTYCDKWYIPKESEVVSRINALNGKFTEGSEFKLYCSEQCKIKCPVFKQRIYHKDFKPEMSREVQPELRQMVLKRDNYKCIKCGSTENLHCHHIEGIRWEPIESADIDKCITVCKSCHIEIHKQKDCSYQDLQCNK